MTSAITGTDLNRDGDNNDRPSGVGFNAGRGDRFFTTDVRVSKKFRFGRGSGEVLWEMLNLFNTVNFNNYQGNQSAAAERRVPPSPSLPVMVYAPMFFRPSTSSITSAVVPWAE